MDQTIASKPMVDLAPGILRQRLVIEGTCIDEVTENQIKAYLFELTSVLGMKALILPLTNKSAKYGWAGWIHWETSGAHFYAWSKPTVFFSVDIYTCKAFVDKDAIAFTSKFFGATQIVSDRKSTRLNSSHTVI